MLNQYNYSLSSKEICVTEKNSGREHWRGKPKGMDVKVILPLQQSEGCIVLLDWFQAEKLSSKNLLRCNHNGDILWEVGSSSEVLFGIKRPSLEIYIAVDIKGDVVLGTSFSGFLDEINLDDGHLVNSIFVK